MRMSTMTTMMKSYRSKSYSELMKLPSYEERLKYLSLNGKVADQTFGGRRMLNQRFYRSQEWKKCRRDIILRDKGCDLACEGMEISDKRNVIVHHLNPITPEDIIKRDPKVLDPENLITVSDFTHRLITYGKEGDPRYQQRKMTERRPGDTCPWR